MNDEDYENTGATTTPASKTGGVHHVGVVVSDIPRTAEFYQRWFGASVALEVAGLTSPEVAEMQGVEEINMDLMYLALPDGSRVELVRYHLPAGRQEVPRRADLGATHVAIAFEDVRGTYSTLRELGLPFNSAPISIDDGPFAGWVVAYTHDPDGNAIELVQEPVQT